MTHMRLYASILGILALVLGASPTPAEAHTIAIGAANAGPGAVTVWLGTYDHGIELNEGSITLNSVTQLFTQLVTSLPAGLVAGSTYFYADATPATWGSLPPGSFHSPTNISGLGNVVAWQGATFTGLSAGIYPYQIAGMFSATWNDINSFEPNWAGSVVITQEAIGPVAVPEPTSLLLFGTGAAALAAKARRRKQQRVQ